MSKKLSRKIIIAFTILLILLTFFSNTIRNFYLPRVEIEAVSNGALLKEITGQGIIQAKDTYEYYVPSNMKVLDLYVQPGQKIVKGQNIAKLDTEDLEKSLMDETSKLNEQKNSLDKQKDISVDLLNADKSIKQAEDKVNQCQAALDNINGLHSSGQATDQQLSSAQRDLGNAKTDYNIAKETKIKMLRDNSLDVQNSEDALSMQQRKVDDLQKQINQNGIVTAAEDGTVMELNFDKGTMANNSKPIYSISNTASGFKLMVTVNGENVDYLNIGQDVDINVSSLNNKIIKGKLTQISDYIPQNNSQQGTAQQGTTTDQRKNLYIELNDSGLKGGETAQIDIVKKTKSYSMLVPNDAVFSDDSGKFVYVTKDVKGPLGTETRIQKADIHDEDNDSTMTAISSGLMIGDKVITRTTKPLTDGGTVIVKQAD